METIRALVQNLIIVVVLAVFLEMLLPNGQMRRYLKMVMGMLVIVAVLQAVGGIFNGDWRLDLPEVAKIEQPPGNSDMEDILASGNKISEKNRGRALEEYKTGLARQVKALAGMNRDAAVADVMVEVYEEPGNKKYGQVKEIRLVLTKTPLSETVTGSGVPLVKPIDVKVGEKHAEKGSDQNKINENSDQPPPELKKAGDDLTRTVANFYNLSKQQVKVVYQ